MPKGMFGKTRNNKKEAGPVLIIEPGDAY